MGGKELEEGEEGGRGGGGGEGGGGANWSDEKWRSEHFGVKLALEVFIQGSRRISLRLSGMHDSMYISKVYQYFCLVLGS